MRVLMLGWEFPPFITGGLGTACYGLTRALDRRGIEVIFALPKSVAANGASHVRLLTPDRLTESAPAPSPLAAKHAPEAESERRERAVSRREIFEHLRFLEVPMVVHGAYTTLSESQKTAIRERFEREVESGKSIEAARAAIEAEIVQNVLPESGDRPAPHSIAEIKAAAAADYGGDLIGQAQQYAHFVLAAARGMKANERFDVIHAHDWLTYPAGLAVARATGRPLVVHVHSTEFDRSGLHVNQPIYDIERRGMHGAMRVITVSQLTKNVVVSRYGVHPDRVEVVYNGVELEPTQPANIGIESKDKIVLYFGRITMQKGPEYFIQAAKRVLEYMDDVKFVVAGSGDQATRMIEMAAALGIGHKILFTGFLRGKDIARVFALADVYVMPSVSEPFGIAPLEAMGHNVPAIISKSSGVSEVLTHALKVDFWDVDDMANKIIAVLRHPTLSRTLQQHGAFEVRRLTWEGAADRCEQIYRWVIDHTPVLAGR